MPGSRIAAVAHQARLGFVPLIEERYDIAVWRAAYFEDADAEAAGVCPQPRAFAERAKTLAGYDVSNLGAVRYNAP